MLMVCTICPKILFWDRCCKAMVVAGLLEVVLNFCHWCRRLSLPALWNSNCLRATCMRCARNCQRPVEGMHAKVGAPLLFHFLFSFAYKLNQWQFDNRHSCLCFNPPSAATRLTVDRADAYVTPTCVFPINYSEEFRVVPPNTDINKSLSCSCWLCSTHTCCDALAPCNFT